MSRFRTDAVIQARLGAKRLPNKMIYALRGRPVIEWVIQRTRRSELIDRLVLATTTASADDVLAAEAARLGVEVFRGEESDVLKRFVGATEGSAATHVVRICADNPLVWGPEIDNLIRFARERHCDYAYNHIPRNNHYPDGLGAEIVPLDVLRLIDRQAGSADHREHIFSYIWDHPGDFSIATFDPPDPTLWHPDMKFDIDSFDDYLRLASLDISIDSTPAEIIRQVKNRRSR